MYVLFDFDGVEELDDGWLVSIRKIDGPKLRAKNVSKSLRAQLDSARLEFEYI